MLHWVFWLAGFALEGILLARLVRGNLLKHYRFFFLYLTCVTFRDFSLFTIYNFWPAMFRYTYWRSELLIVVVGCGVVWEAYKEALTRYPGAARMARNVLAFLFIFFISRLLVKAWNSPNWIPGRTTLETERDLRVVQMALLLGLVALFSYYAIPLGRNLKGIVYGFSVVVGATLIHLTFQSYLGRNFRYVGPYVQPLVYLMVLLAWCKTLWSYEAAAEVASDSRLEGDYRSLAAATKKQLRTAHSHLLKAVRP